MSKVKENVLMSFFWKVSERITSQFISLVISVIIARILSPNDYGVVSIITIFFSFANIFVIGGLSTALIQKKDADMLDYSTVLYSSLFISIIVYVAIFWGAPIIAAIYHQPILTLMIRIMGITLPITAIQAVWNAYVSSAMLFKKIFSSTLGGTLFSGIVGLWMAKNGYGAWALVAQQMLQVIVNTIILVLITKIQIIFCFSFSRFKCLWRFGWKIFLSSIISTIYSEVTPLIIGLKFDSTDLSYYTKGRNFPGLISNTMTASLAAVLFPVLSKKQDDKKFQLEYLRKYIRLSSFVIFPLMMGFLMVADTFISVILTDKWLPTVPYIKIFCMAYMFDMLCVGNCEVIKAMGRSDVFLTIEIIKKSLYFAVIVLFVFTMPSAILLAVSAIICSLIAVVVNSVPNRKLLGYKYGYQLLDILPNFLNALIMCMGVGVVGLLDINKTLLLIIQVISGIVIYIFLSAVSKNLSLQYILAYFKLMFKLNGENI